ncbi:MAG: hypothetical protein ACQEQV_09010 [Fibrobacterota bacterium]
MLAGIVILGGLFFWRFNKPLNTEHIGILVLGLVIYVYGRICAFLDKQDRKQDRDRR